MNNDNAVQQDKFRPFDATKCKPGDSVVSVDGDHGRFIALVPDARPDSVALVKWRNSPATIGYTQDGRFTLNSSVTVVLPPLDPLDEIDPSPGNVDKLTRRQVGEGKRIPAHDEEPDPRAEYWHGETWDPNCSPRARGRYLPNCTYRVPIAPATVPLEQSDIVLGKTVVRAKGGSGEFLVIAKRPEGLWPAGRTGEACVTWAELREVYDISFDHGVTWQKAEKKGGSK